MGNVMGGAALLLQGMTVRSEDQGEDEFCGIRSPSNSCCSSALWLGRGLAAFGQHKRGQLIYNLVIVFQALICQRGCCRLGSPMSL